ncbi:MAG TPA: M6 family metalloprotease domain-containing protein, partial [Paludibacter sp.]|nr:M6 family metalloprotease domain-containing protein [Paludibacter sp.]
MIRRNLLFLLVAIALQPGINHVFAVKAYPAPIQVRQPDGTELTVRLHGDEFRHYKTTGDGFLIRQDSRGFYTYATVDSNGVIVGGTTIARDAKNRSAAETRYLQGIDKLRVASAIESTRQKSRKILSSASAAPRKAYPLDGSPKALVILANFSDNTFSVDNPQASFQNLATQSGYSANGGTGSAKDYFMSSSYGKFAPDFVVVGPVTLPQDLAYYGTNDLNGDDKYPAQMVVDACTAANAAGLDFTQFDTDGDGYIDNVFVYYAGYNEAEGADSTTIWPHRWQVLARSEDLAGYNYPGTVASKTFDGKILLDYSCTSELKGNSGSNMCGIGTFCHEFGHVLGLPDFYDTSGTQSYTLETWDIMDTGPYLNGGSTPPAYSAYERFYLGYLTPEQISTASNITLDPLYLGTSAVSSTAGQSYLFAASSHNMSATSPSPAEFFMVEYRKHTGWDRFLGQSINNINTYTGIPSDGLCIWHVDYSQLAWDQNTPNNYTGSTQTASSHMRLYLQPLVGQSTTPGTTFTDGSFIPTTWVGTNIDRPVTSIALNPENATFKFMGGVFVFGNFSALNATNLAPTGFTANWSEASGATGYLLNVYT